MAESLAPDIEHLLASAFKLGVSDIHIRSCRRPMYRVDGQLRAVDFREIGMGEVEALSERLSTIEREQLRRRRFAEFSCQFQDLGRFRGHFYLQGGLPAVALRTIPRSIPTLQELRLPAQLKRISESTSGLILVTGATGVGKSTTLAAILSMIAANSCRHLVTIEDPIEYQVPDGTSCVTQREVGRDVETFAEGLRSGLRQDPDVVMIGEARDRETLEVVLHAATTGHLVLTAVHFTDALATIQGIISLFYGRDQVAWRYRLAEALRCIISQKLISRRDGGGRVVATEMLVSDPSITAAVQDEGKLKGLRAMMARARNQTGSHTFDQSLIELLAAKQISLEVAQAAATSPSELLREVNLRRLV